MEYRHLEGFFLNSYLCQEGLKLISRKLHRLARDLIKYFMGFISH